MWITGLPASGKSTLTAALRRELAAAGVDAAVLESDELRKVLTPNPRYDEAERDLFYEQMTYIGALLARHGVPVIFDATANLRRYRDRARSRIARFLEVYVDVPLEACMERDPKGIYRQGRNGGNSSVPGLQAAYEPPESPEVVFHGDTESPEAGARRIVECLRVKGYLADPS